jgi:type IX secretion system PorP/SprF family membrane protein
MLTYDTRMMQKKWKTSWLAGGLNIFQDKAGDGNMKTLQVNGVIGYHTQMNNQNTLGGSLLIGYSGRSIDYSKLTWDNQYDGTTFDSQAQTGEEALQGSNKFGYPDFGLGILYQFNKGQMYSTANDMVIIHTGLALTHLHKPKYSFYQNVNEKLYPKFIGHIDAVIGISEILPGSYFRYTLREESKFTGYVKGASVMVGTHLRLKDAFIPSVQLEVSEYTLGVSYDMNISGLKSVTSGKGGFEISLRYGNPSSFLYQSAASFQ